MDRLVEQRTAPLLMALNTASDQWSSKIDDLAQRIQHISDQVKLQQAVTSVNYDTFAEYRACHTGRDVVVVAAGPSLNYYRPIENAIHVGVNRVFQYPKVHLDYYFAQDFTNPNLPQFRQLDQVTAKIFLGIVANQAYQEINASESLSVRLGASRYYFDTSPSDMIYPDIRFFPLADYFTVVFPAIQFALYTNPAKLYLVGCDTSYFGYFSNDHQTESYDQMTMYLSHRLAGYIKLKKFAAQYYPDTCIYSINPVNLRGLFSDVFTDGFEQNTASAVGYKTLFESTDWKDVTEDDIRRFVAQHVEEVRRSQHGNDQGDSPASP